jgi:putative methyltransferase (TIGR04325 family)
MDKKVIKELVPPVFLRMITGLFYGWHGNYPSWNEATKKSGGYDSLSILEKVKASSLKVKNGSAVYERDSLIFDQIEYSFPLLTGLLWIAGRNNGKLNVLDFGGSLGSTYFQNKSFLDTLADVNWCIVEQREVVKTGIENFEDQRLHFFYSIDECLKTYDIHMVLLSSVLQYLEEPYKLLDEIISHKPEYIIIDRTPFVKGNDRITIQTVNPKIYKGSYPCWFFNENKFVSSLIPSYKMIVEFDALDRANINSEFKGFIFQKAIKDQQKIS